MQKRSQRTLQCEGTFETPENDSLGDRFPLFYKWLFPPSGHLETLESGRSGSCWLPHRQSHRWLLEQLASFEWVCVNDGPWPVISNYLKYQITYCNTWKRDSRTLRIEARSQLGKKGDVAFCRSLVGNQRCNCSTHRNRRPPGRIRKHILRPSRQRRPCWSDLTLELTESKQPSPYL